MCTSSDFRGRRQVLGDEISVPTLEGPHSLLIPEGTQSGTELKIRGKGIPEVQGRGRGDLVVHIEVKIPSKLTKDQREAVRRLGLDTLPVNNEPHGRACSPRSKKDLVHVRLCWRI